jgi:hypothetical protein
LQDGIEHEITFDAHEGYVFHNAPGFNYGGTKEIEQVQEFVIRKSKERRLEDRLHAIWFVSFGYLQLQTHKVCLQVLHFDGQSSATARQPVF